MGTKKQYKLSTKEYEEKLQRVMERFGVEEGNYDYDWTRTTAFVKFLYEGQWYFFDHSVEKANATGKVNLVYGTDVFAQLVIALEDLARMSERGIYGLSTWLSGMKYLPEFKDIPECFKFMGFTGSQLPSEEDLTARYKNLLKIKHPDTAEGSNEDFIRLQEEMKKCLDVLKTQG